jgi:hypothetical protein
VTEVGILETVCGVKFDRFAPWTRERLAKYLGMMWVSAAGRPQVAAALSGAGCSLEGLRNGASMFGKCFEGLAGSAGPFGDAEKAFAAKLTACPAACADFVKDAGAACAKAVDATFNYAGPGKPPGFVALAATRIADLCSAAAPEPVPEPVPAAPRCAKRPFPNATIPSKYNLGPPAPAASTEACCERCAAVTACRAWTLNPKGACQLKSKNDYQYKVGAASSLVEPSKAAEPTKLSDQPNSTNQPLLAGVVLLGRVAHRPNRHARSRSRHFSPSFLPLFLPPHCLPPPHSFHSSLLPWRPRRARFARVPHPQSPSASRATSSRAPSRPHASPCCQPLRTRPLFFRPRLAPSVTMWTI